MSPGKGSYKPRAIPMPKGKGKLVGSGCAKKSPLRPMLSHLNVRPAVIADDDVRLPSTCPAGDGASTVLPSSVSQVTPPPIVVRHRLTRTPIVPGCSLGGPGTEVKSSGYDGIDIQLGQGTPAVAAEKQTPLATSSGLEDNLLGSLRFLETSVMSAGDGAAGRETVPVQDAPRLADRLLNRSVAELDKSRLHRDIKEAVLAGLHGLHGMVLRLADSRARHIAERERARLIADQQYALQQRVYTNKLEAITECMQSGMDELRDTVTRSLKEAEASRHLIEQVNEMIAAPGEVAKYRLVGQLLEEAQAIREEYCNSPRQVGRDLAPVGPVEPAILARQRVADQSGALRTAVPHLAGAHISYAHAAKHPLLVRSKNPAHTVKKKIKKDKR